MGVGSCVGQGEWDSGLGAGEGAQRLPSTDTPLLRGLRNQGFLAAHTQV